MAPPTPDSVMQWLYQNYTGQQVAGQTEAPPQVRALVGWCNATRNLASGNLSQRDRQQAEASVAAGEAYLPLVQE